MIEVHDCRGEEQEEEVVLGRQASERVGPHIFVMPVCPKCHRMSERSQVTRLGTTTSSPTIP